MDSNLISIAKNLRKRPTEAERLLWRHLRGEYFKGLKFRRQQPIGRYVVDFVCFDRRVVIEVDGGQHAENKGKDIERDEWLQGQGFKILRFWNNEVSGNIKGVLEKIKESFVNLTLPLPPPIEGGDSYGCSHRGRGKN